MTEISRKELIQRAARTAILSITVANAVRTLLTKRCLQPVIILMAAGKWIKTQLVHRVDPGIVYAVYAVILIQIRCLHMGTIGVAGTDKVIRIA